MNRNNITRQIIAAVVIGILCYVASFMVLGLVLERENNFEEAKTDVAQTWGKTQTIVGPVLTFVDQNPADPNYVARTYHVLPKTLNYEADLVPEIRSKGIFDSVVYTSKLKITGSFSADDIEKIDIPSYKRQVPNFSLGITDTRGIEKQVALEWNGNPLNLNPGAGDHAVASSSGLHADARLSPKREFPFALEITLKGSEGINFLPLGQETETHITSSWRTPEFTGNYLPTERAFHSQGFDATWRLSSFGRSYPSVLTDGFNRDDFFRTAFGVNLFQGIDLYTKLMRSIKYAILFIAVTFIAFILFEVLLALRIHSIQYFLVGAALALFYLLLLSFSEQIGFEWAYLISTIMTALLIAGYSYKFLKSGRRAMLIFGVLALLYSYLYFVLQLEDYALIFGSLLLFGLLASIMYLTRNVDWYNLSSDKTKISG